MHHPSPLRRARPRPPVDLDPSSSSASPALVHSDRGQATAEYALVLLGAAVIAVALITWATGSGRVGELFDAVFDQLQSRL